MGLLQSQFFESFIGSYIKHKTDGAMCFQLSSIKEYLERKKILLWVRLKWKKKQMKGSSFRFKFMSTLKTRCEKNVPRT